MSKARSRYQGLTGVPAWAQDVAVNQIKNISGTALQGSAGLASPALSTGYPSPGGDSGVAGRVNAYGHGVVRNAEWWNLAAGGHKDYGGNEASKIDFDANVPAWSLVRTYSATISDDVDRNPDGRPASCHGYYCWQYISQEDKFHRFGSQGRFSNGGGSGITHDIFDPQAGDYVTSGHPADLGGDAANYGTRGLYPAIAKDTSGNVYIITVSGGLVTKWTRATDAFADLATNNGTQRTSGPIVDDPVRGHLFHLYVTGGVLTCAKYSKTTGQRTAITFNASAAATALAAIAGLNNGGIEYCTPRDSYLIYDGTTGNEGDVYEIIPNSGTTYDVDTLATTGDTPDTVNSAGLYSRWREVTLACGFKGMLMQPSFSGRFAFLRTA